MTSSDDATMVDDEDDALITNTSSSPSSSSTSSSSSSSSSSPSWLKPKSELSSYKSSSHSSSSSSSSSPSSSSSSSPPPSSSSSSSSSAPSSSSSSSSSAPKSTIAASSLASDFNQPFVEKYRPRFLDEVVGNEETIARLKSIAKHGNMPNLIVAGPPGIGKTTSILCLAREMLMGAPSSSSSASSSSSSSSSSSASSSSPPASIYDSAVLELNASDTRGIDVIRDKVKAFARQKVSLPPSMHKLIILDEADSLTTGAQQALRRTMELYSSTTRFALACNSSSSIIEPIQSRCAIVRLTRLCDEAILKRLMSVMEAEKIVEYDNSGLEALIFTSGGDMRAALNTLQSTHSGLGAITSDNVFKVVDQPHPFILRRIIALAINNELKAACAALIELIQKGYSAVDLVSTMFRVIKSWSSEPGDKLPALLKSSSSSSSSRSRNRDIDPLTSMPLDDRLKLELCREVAMTQVRIAEGVSSACQLTGLIARFSQVAEELKKVK